MGVDTMGNMFATRAGTDAAALPVYMGSHLDTQPTGGRYDGVLGVLGALEVVRTLNDMGVKTLLKAPDRGDELDKRGRRAVCAGDAGLGCLCGDSYRGVCEVRRDLDGKVFGEELARIGWVGDEKVGARKMHAMLELHIEQLHPGGRGERDRRCHPRAGLVVAWRSR